MEVIVNVVDYRKVSGTVLLKEIVDVKQTKPLVGSGVGYRVPLICGLSRDEPHESRHVGGIQRAMSQHCCKMGASLISFVQQWHSSPCLLRGQL